MNITCFKSLFVLLCLFFGAQEADAQCNITLAADVTQISCFGETGSIDLTVNNATQPVSYTWSNGELDEDIIGLPVGTYIVTVIDGLGCIANLARTIDGPAEALVLGLNNDGIVNCQNGASTITPDPYGGTEPYSFLWSTGSTDGNISTLQEGTYTLTVTDANGCTVSAENTVVVSPTFPISDAGPDLFISCATAPNIIGGSGTSIGPDFTYYWWSFTGQIDPWVDINQPFIEVSHSGDYFLRVTSLVEGCYNESLVFVQVVGSFPTISIQPPQPLSCQVTQVTLDASASSTGPQYSYLWTTNNGHIVSGETTLTPVVDAPGTYLLNLSDNQQGCTVKNQVTVVANQGSHVVNAGPDTGIPCGGSQVTLNGNGSSSGPQYTYLWTTLDGNIVSGATAATPTVDQPGTYTLHVLDNQNGCEKSDAVRVFPGPAIPISDISVIDVSCTGPLGSATVNMSQGTGPYTYLWSNGSTQAGINNVAQGIYGVTVTDAAACNYYADIIIKENVTIILSTQTTLPDCAGGMNGAIDLTATGGLNPISYQWSTGANTQDISGLVAGTYTVTVTYGLGTCSKTLSVQVQPASFTLSTTVTNANSCLGTHGLINLSEGGGVSPYTYLWSDGETSQDASPAGPGTYTVTVVDALGCSSTASATINDASSMDLSTVVVNANCTAGFCTGSINLTINGGLPPFDYAWSPGITDQDIFNQCPGTYTVTVTDVNGCTKTITSVITTLSSDIVANCVPDDASCFANDGSIAVTVTGGFSPFYFFTWSNGSTVEDLANLPSGTYTVTVTDQEGCSSTASTTVGSQGASFTLTVVTGNASCNGNDGTIDLTVNGGSGPFIYLWSDGNTVEDLTNLPAGIYTVTVTDAGGCTQTTEATINQNALFDISGAIVPSTTCAIPFNGAIDVSITLGGSYTYVWSNGATTEDLSNLSPGSYTVTVSDGTACQLSKSFVVPDNAIFPQASATTTNSVCDLSNGGINLTVNNGVGPFGYQWSNGVITQDLSNILAGSYQVTVTGANTCTVVVPVTVTNINPTITLTGNVTPSTSCVQSNGSIDLTVAPPGSYTVLWANGATTQDISNLPPGDYSVTVSAGGSCTETATYNVPDNSNTPNISPTVTDATCNGGIDGAIDLDITLGVPPYTVNWSHIPGVNNPEDVTNLVAGTYTCTVTDAAGCVQIASSTVGQNTNLSLTSTFTNVSCFGGTNGTIDLTVSGGVSPYTYLWPGGATTQDRSGLMAGTFSVTVTDNAGCSKTHSQSIGQPTDITLSLTTNSVQCFGGSDGAINLSVSGGTAPYIYAWTNGATTQDLAGLPAGVYTVTVFDANTCTKATIATVNQPVSIAFSIVSLSNDCNSETITGPNSPDFVYQWTGPNGFVANTAAVTANFSGTYSLTITNVTGCTATNEYDVNLSGAGACGVLKGKVFHDEDESCALDFGEPGLAGWIVRAEGANDTLYGVTGVQGQYFVGVPVGTYSMKVLVPNGLWSVCPGGTNATVGMAGDTVAGGDFPVKAAHICPALTVSVGTNQLRRCFGNNFYQVEYCNQGTQAAEDAFVTVVLDPFLTPLSSSIPYTNQGANVLRFEVGDLDVGECGSFNIQVYVNCNAVLGQTHCTSASIYPDTLCVPTSSNWSGASLQVQSICNNDSLRFVIQNAGKADMSSTREYIVVEDGIMFRSGTLAPLAEDETMEIAVPANGSTWRVEVEQEAYHPFPSPVGLSIEGCTANSSFSTGFVNQFPTPDESPAQDIDCTTNTGSFDPNDKYGYPVGYGADHYVRPGTDIEYLIRFQNTGSDTAFTVRIVDTLSSWLDPTSIRFGASSHPYRYDLTGEGVVHFIFDNILLPDSNTNEVASHGFAKFVIKPRSDAPLETIIENTAAIYFDFNDPVFTNTTTHRLGHNFVKVGVWQPFVPEAQVSVVPNPFGEETTLEVKGLRRKDLLWLHVFDLQGNLVRQMESTEEMFRLKRADMPPGIYLFKVTQGGRLVGNGKLVAE